MPGIRPELSSNFGRRKLLAFCSKNETMSVFHSPSAGRLVEERPTFARKKYYCAKVSIDLLWMKPNIDCTIGAPSLAMSSIVARRRPLVARPSHFQRKTFSRVPERHQSIRKTIRLLFVSKRQRESMSAFDLFSHRSIGTYFQSIFLNRIHFDTVAIIKIRFFLKDY
jgi:hypothetical protein